MVNSREIKDLHPTLQRAATEFIRRMKIKGYDTLITSTYRDKEYQDLLYQIGRGKEGKIVTNLKGGQSVHNFKLAFDICKNEKNGAYSDNEFFMVGGSVWKEMGGEWGGDWVNFVDKPHMQFTNGLTISQLQRGIQMPEIKMPWELESEANERVKFSFLENNFEVEGFNKDGYSFVKARELLEKIGYKVLWDGKIKTVIIKVI